MDSKRLTEEERQALMELGWDESMPLPDKTAEAIAVLQEMSKLRGQLSKDAWKNMLRFRLESLVEQEQEQAFNVEDVKQRLAPGVQQGFEELVKTIKPPASAGAAADDVRVEIDKPASQSAESSAGKASGPAEAVDTGAGGPSLARCPHCNWDLRYKDVPDPPESKKIAYLHAMLAPKCFTDEVSIFDNTLIATFRTLTPWELNVVYKQAFRDMQTGRARSDIDFWERINFYRLYLQLCGLRTVKPGPLGFVHDLPDGLSPETNNMARRYWQLDPPPEGETLLVPLEKYILDNVLKTESLFRVVNAACNHFNRMVAKLEALWNSNFFTPSAPPS